MINRMRPDLIFNFIGRIIFRNKLNLKEKHNFC